MAFPMDRTRSNHSVRSIHRPISRASTTSAASPAPEMMQQEMYAQQMMTSGPEAALLQYAGAQNGVGMDQFMQQQFAQQQMQPTIEQYPQRPFTPQEEQFMMQSAGFAPQMQFAPAMAPGLEHEDRRRKNSAATATNDKELRELLARNESRALKEVAQEVIQKERTPQAEKTKQLFAMLWLRKVCKPAKSSVPRNRVYSHYATRCGTERVVPLNPASFGKLVRVIFPGIQTRRLGVRGESKYHYVDLALCEEEENQQSSSGDGQIDFRRSTSTGAPSDFAAGPRMNADTAAFPPADSGLDFDPTPQPDNRGPPSQGRLFAYPDSRGMQRDQDASLMYEQILRFPIKSIGDIEGDDSIALPNIHPYCPPKTDVDTAEALVALYRTHCTSLIDCIRFCKEKQFFRLFTSFHGTLTVPVQKLFSNPNLAPWIQECDYLMYQKMVRFVSRLTLQAAPPIVITILNNISTNLHAHISKTFQSHPSHVLDAKLKPAATFASLLHRLIRVNAAAHAAANLLTVDQNREQMWREWVSMVNPKRVMEGELPDCGYEEVYKILTCDIRSLLEPLQAPPFPDSPMFAFDNQAYNSSQNSFGPTAAADFNENGSASTENVLDRWASFLTALPARFPSANTRTLLHCIEAIGTAALRDITIMGGASYQTWWVMKIFVDEMSLWLAAMGGFLERVPADSRTAALSAKNGTPVMINGEMQRSNSSRSATASRMSSVEGELNPARNAINEQGDQQGASSAPQLSRTHSTHSIHSAHEFSHAFDSSLAPTQSAGNGQRRSLSRSQSHMHPLPQTQHFQQTPQISHQQQQDHSSLFQSPTNFNFDLSTNQENQQPDFNSSIAVHSNQQKEDVDDSGICMNYTDEDFMAKFGFTNNQSHDLISNELGVNVM